MAIALSAVPARFAARVNLIDVLKSSGPGSGQPSTTRTLTMIVGMQIALSTILLVGAGLLVRTYLNAERVDPVFRSQGVATATLDLNQLGNRIDRRRFSEELLARAAALPGVERASLARESLLGLGSSGRPIAVSRRRSAVRCVDARPGRIVRRVAGLFRHARHTAGGGPGLRAGRSRHAAGHDSQRDAGAPVVAGRPGDRPLCAARVRRAGRGDCHRKGREAAIARRGAASGPLSAVRARILAADDAARPSVERRRDSARADACRDPRAESESGGRRHANARRSRRGCTGAAQRPRAVPCRQSARSVS